MEIPFSPGSRGRSDHARPHGRAPYCHLPRAAARSRNRVWRCGDVAHRRFSARAAIHCKLEIPTVGILALKLFEGIDCLGQTANIGFARAIARGWPE